MVTEVKEGKSKFRRLSDAEQGKVPPPKFQEKDAEIWAGLKRNFPYHAERPCRQGGGKRRYTPIEKQEAKLGKKRKDYFDPSYGQCPYPSKDSAKDIEGWMDRCEFEIPVDAKGRVVQAELDPRLIKGYGEVNKGTIYEQITSLKQYIFMKHCELEHWDWYRDEFGVKYKHSDGKMYLRPPDFTEIIPPEWELVA